MVCVDIAPLLPLCWHCGRVSPQLWANPQWNVGMWGLVSRGNAYGSKPCPVLHRTTRGVQ